MFYIHNVKIHIKLFKSLADLTTTQNCIFKTNTSGEKLKGKKRKCWHSEDFSMLSSERYVEDKEEAWISLQTNPAKNKQKDLLASKLFPETMV